MTKGIISFALYGNDPKYCVGARKNIELINGLLPDWKTVIMTSNQVTDQKILDELEALGADVVDATLFQPGKKHPLDYKMWWRYFPFFDNDAVIVRDLDSRISLREIEYLNRWVESGKDFFIIRDHPWHSPVPGGLIGKKNHGALFKEHFVEWSDNKSTDWGSDQVMLAAFLETQKDSIYYCGFDREDNYIPRDNKDFFIGIQLDEEDKCLSTVALTYLKDLNL